MLCAISGEAPQVPVASRKSGTIFERRLIESYIQEHGRDPVTGEELSVEDLMDLKTQRVVKPRPPTFTSIPSLLSTFQNEWDAITLESFTLKQHLSQLRQELSTALYNNDAAARVIARLTQERNEARDALSKLSLSDKQPAEAHSDAMQLDGSQLPSAIAATVDETQAKLMKTRRKRPIPDDWATPERISSMNVRKTTSPLVAAQSRCVYLDPLSDNIILGGLDGHAVLYSLVKHASVQDLSTGSSSITSALQVKRENGVGLLLATSGGEVAMYDVSGAKRASLTSHVGPINGLAIHPSGKLALSAGTDKRFVLYSLETFQAVMQIYSDSELLCCQFHPDGHIFAVGGSDGQIKVFETKTGANAANFSASGPVHALAFSENGTWLGSAVQGTSSVSIWDLRKAACLEELEFGSVVQAIAFDYTGQFLAVATSDCVAVQYYDKGSKTWSEPLRRAIGATGVSWMRNAQGIAALGLSGELVIVE